MSAGVRSIGAGAGAKAGLEFGFGTPAMMH